MNKNILVTGGAGYIGSVLVENLLKDGNKVKVLDRLYFGIEPLGDFLNNPHFELFKEDIRYTNKKIFEGVDIVIHLAALSNDPTCEMNPLVTRSINYTGTIRLARLAKESGVKRFIFSSSCSVYGSGDSLRLTEESLVNPVSLYAKTKVLAERELLKMADKNFTVTIMRNATVYGLSKRIRFDLVVNIMTLHAFKNRKVYLSGGGLQWRPVVHIQDVSDAFLKVVQAPHDTVQRQTFNVGSNEQNYQVFQVANMVREVIPDIIIENVPSDPEKRNYNVNFDKIKNILNYFPGRSVKDGIVEVKEALERGIIIDDIKTSNLNYYKYLLEANKIAQSVTRRGKLF